MNLKIVFKNTFVLGISQFISKLFLFFLTVFIARYLKESGFGQYSLVLTIVGFFNLFTNFGFGTIAFREISKNYSEANKYFNNILFLRIGLAIVSFLLLCITVNILRYPSGIVTAAYIYGLTLFTNNIVDLLTSVFNAFEKMEYMAILNISLSLLTLGMAFFALKTGHGLIALVSISVIAGIATVILGIFLATRHVYISIKELNFNFCRDIIKNSVPLMLLGFIGLLYFRLDIVLLSKMKRDSDVGLYSAAYKIMDAFMIVSNSIIGATFPHLSRYSKTSYESLKKLFKKLSFILFALGILFAFIVFLFSKQIILLFYGSAFTNSILALKILIWTVPLIYINSVLLYTLIASNLQLKIVLIVVIATVINFTLNFVFIPQYNYIASSIITVISESVVFCGYYYLVRKKLSLSLI
ncbi:MAG: flippase [Elusimicrobia bacterium]|nr:flippase [Elusimicrobiota bacterium]